ncbi:SurA N-terminal domain-containing protein [Pseudoxanthobacter sp.]|uniref:SurA N-terminal domain-containing protein n=1 Tax=Pseudoxanthobacter sp. TaxID=1925742 RepID=UPI002FE3A72E
MTAFRLACVLACALTFGSVAGVHPAAAQMTVKVVVNDLPITSYDIAQRAALLKLTVRPPNPTQAAIDELIQERLQFQEAGRMGVKVPDSQVNQAFDSIAQRVKLTPAQLGQVLAQAGSSAAELKSRLRTQLMWGEVVRKKFRGSGGVSDQDVVRALAAKGTGNISHKTVEWDLVKITFVVPAKTAAAGRPARMTEAEQLRARFTSCEQGIPLARGLPAVVVKPLGKRMESDLPKPMIEILNSIPVGHLGKPDNGENGIDMIAVCGRRELASDAAARAEMRDELTNEQGNLAARRYLRDLQRNAVIEYR